MQVFITMRTIQSPSIPNSQMLIILFWNRIATSTAVARYESHWNRIALWHLSRAFRARLHKTRINVLVVIISTILTAVWCWAADS